MARSILPSCDDLGVDLLEKLDPRRHDAAAVLDAVNEFGGLTDAEQDAYAGLWDFAGLDEASHPLTALLREGHNETLVVRDLRGDLVFLWQQTSTSDRWRAGPLFQEHVIGEDEIEELLEGDPDWLADRDISLPPSELARLIMGLPSAPGPVMQF